MDTEQARQEAKKRNRVVALTRSGWSFYFRWPASHVEPFLPTGIFLGPILQAALALFASACFLFVTWILYWVTGHAFNVYAAASHSLFFGSLALAIISGLFHEDGLADTADSLGVPSYGRRPERIARIIDAMRDPRLGTYGVTALVLLWIARYQGLTCLARLPQEHESTRLLLHTLQACLVQLCLIYWSRWSGLAAASCLLPDHSAVGTDPASGRPSSSHNLAELAPHVRQRWLLATGTLGLALIWLCVLAREPAEGAATATAAAVGLWAGLVGSGFGAAVLLQRTLSKRMGGIGGDLIGASICATESFFIFALLILN